MSVSASFPAYASCLSNLRYRLHSSSSLSVAIWPSFLNSSAPNFAAMVSHSSRKGFRRPITVLRTMMGLPWCPLSFLRSIFTSSGRIFFNASRTFDSSSVACTNVLRVAELNGNSISTAQITCPYPYAAILELYDRPGSGHGAPDRDVQRLQSTRALDRCGLLGGGDRAL